MAIKQTSIRLDPAIKADLERLAKEDDRPLSVYVARVLAEHVRSKTALKGQRQAQS